MIQNFYNKQLFTWFKTVKKFSLLFLLVCSCLTCNQSDYNLAPQNYPINEVVEAYGLFTEGGLTKDNLIYAKCDSFIFKYYIEKDGKKFLAQPFSKSNPFSDFDFIEYESKNEHIHFEKFLLYTPKEKPKNFTIPREQSLIKSIWYLSDNSIYLDLNEGIIENYKNVWIHPFRFYQMWPTFTAPWPYVKLPVEIGEEYTWNKKLDGAWSSENYLKWEGIVSFNYHYKVSGQTTVIVNNQSIDCFIINAIGDSELGKTALVFYFNPTLGFIRFEYTTMEDAKIVLYLDDFKVSE